MGRVRAEFMPSSSLAITPLSWIGLTLALCTTAYACLSLWAWYRCERLRKHPRADVNERASQAVSILKPLHGAEPGLFENLESFCLQDYSGPVQIVFGVHDEADPATKAVKVASATG